MELIHGGDRAGYRMTYGREPLDFSVNVSPLGLPRGALRAAEEALKRTGQYPDPLCRELRDALAEYHGVSAERIVCGNGASELIDRICRTRRPKEAAVLTPGFAEYERALSAQNCRIAEIPLINGEDFRVSEETVRAIPESCELLFLCNPNNPTGLLAEEGAVRALLERCCETGMLLVADECFLDFTEKPERYSLIPALEHGRNLAVLRAFTKTWAMAGLRLGYVLCGNQKLAEALQDAGQPWPVSSVAQAAGAAALGERDYLPKLRNLITAERTRMIRGLETLGFRVIHGEANFLLFQTEHRDLFHRLAEKGILIRDCGNFPGLGSGWFRVAVRTPEENSRLLQTMGEVL